MDEPADLATLTTRIVSAYVSRNEIAPQALPGLIRSVHDTLADLQDQATGAPPRREPAVPIAESIGDDFIICLEDGKKFKSLKRHLRSQYGLSPEQYRARWSLPDDYPMVAPSYAKARSALAKKSGLGRTTAPPKRRKPS